MIIVPQDALLQEKIDLYNNIASSGDCNGALQASLHVYPAPHIVWKFEKLGKSACEPPRVEEDMTEPFLGTWFTIEKPYISWIEPDFIAGLPRTFLEGKAAHATFGDVDHNFHSFRFYLPNARFQEVNVAGRQLLFMEAGFESEEKTPPIHDATVHERTERRLTRAQLTDNWEVYLETKENALRWLSPSQDNVGTFITTTGHLYCSTKQEAKSTGKSTLSMDKALKMLHALSILLSFANGGYLGPLYVEGLRQRGKGITFAAEVLVYRTTPLEQLGTSNCPGRCPENEPLPGSKK